MTRHLFNPAAVDTEESVVISVAGKEFLRAGLSPLALSRTLVQSWTGDETTPRHHCLQKTRKKRQTI